MPSDAFPRAEDRCLPLTHLRRVGSIAAVGAARSKRAGHGANGGLSLVEAKCRRRSREQSRENAVSRRPVVIRTAMRAGILVAAAIGAMCGVVQVSSATAAERPPTCCFSVLVRSFGRFMQNYGTTPSSSNENIGTESFRWEWKETGVLEFTESRSGVPDLEDARTATGHFAPVVYLDSTWTSESDEAYCGFVESGQQCPLTPCKHNFSEKAHRGYDSSVGVVDIVGATSVPNVQQAFKGHKYIWQVSGGNSPGLTPCGIESDVAVGLEPPPGLSGYPEQAEQLFGPFNYYLTLPPSNDLRHAKGARDHFKTKYHVSTSFRVSAPRPHLTEEETAFEAEFTWFPRSDLERVIKTASKLPVRDG